MICVLNDSRKQTSHHGKEARETQPQACGLPALPFHQNPPGITATGQHFRKSRNVRDSAYLLCMAGLPVSTAHLPSNVLRSPHHQAICLSPSYLERNSGPHLYRKCFSNSAIPLSLRDLFKGVCESGEVCRSSSEKAPAFTRDGEAKFSRYQLVGFSSPVTLMLPLSQLGPHSGYLYE